MTYRYSNASPGLAPPTRSPALPHPGTPLATRDLYTGTTPQLRRTSDLLSRSPSSISGGLRGVPLSPSSSGFASPTNMEGSLGGTACPPLNATELIYEIQTGDGQNLRPEIFGRIDKGFFQADGDWTCYRRNYFSLNCSYTLQPALPTGTIFLAQNGHKGYQVYSFAMSIAAVVDGRDGKSIELVQHTPKRDKGPQEKPGRVTLAPRPPALHGMYGDGGLGSSSRGGSLYDNPGFGQNPNQPQVEATFERIQFKNATANNGKRRAAQQYYHLLIELFADVGQQHPDRFVKIAFRMSAPMVVRGRSPGHYQSERRGSNASTGPGSGGAGGAGSYTPSAGTSRTPGDMNMSGTSSMHPGSSYGNSYDNRSHHYRAHIAPLQIPMEPVLSAEEAKSIEESPGYLYYPGPIYEGSHHEARYQLPSMSDYTTSKVKQEYGQGGYVLPSLASTQDSLNRHCGRWEGTAESKGYYPTSLIQQELNIS
ncbi:Meiosis-specific transcription factor [Lachnellula hyalina]|uniref:Meiosis-specific transcription factor n=1 Tax=Lachnellula hyalina TaxID=1316788 RepID=A0A8H8QY94_9HELO|nr:Meiosis-specific transcription factor [Lachnellula hyalina]TVY23955.1 Meiosis-specific transcription factor [Lachnellula hyalina]